MPGGRPPKYAAVEDMDEVIDNYFNNLGDNIPTMAGLALELDMTSRGLRNYREKTEFFPSIKKARQKVEAAWEQAMIKGGGGAIFWMKNNADYQDRITNENINRDATGLSDQQLADIAAGRS